MTDNIDIETKVIGNLISWLVINTDASPERVKIAEILSAAEKQRQQEPVGFIDEADEGIFGDVQTGIAEGLCKVGDLLFTTPPDQSREIEQLKADNNKLREALEDISNWTFGWDGDCGVTAVANQALAATPAQSLQQFENDVIERCAKVAEDYMFASIEATKDVSNKIRALKVSND